MLKSWRKLWARSAQCINGRCCPPNKKGEKKKRKENKEKEKRITKRKQKTLCAKGCCPSKNKNEKKKEKKTKRKYKKNKEEKKKKKKKKEIQKQRRENFWCKVHNASIAIVVLERTQLTLLNAALTIIMLLLSLKIVFLHT